MKRILLTLCIVFIAGIGWGEDYKIKIPCEDNMAWNDNNSDNSMSISIEPVLEGEQYIDTTDTTTLAKWDDIKYMVFGKDDYCYRIGADDLRSLSREEADNLATALKLFNSDAYWTAEMSRAIIETFIPIRFKIEDTK